MPKGDSSICLYRAVTNFVVVYFVSELIVHVQAANANNEAQEARAAEKEFNKLVDWDYAGLEMIHGISDTDKINYFNLLHMRRERQESKCQQTLLLMNINKIHTL